MQRDKLLITILLAMTLCITSCDDSTVFCQYKEVTPTLTDNGEKGWDVNDELSFTTPVIPSTDNYNIILCLRVNEHFPYTAFAVAGAVEIYSWHELQTGEEVKKISFQGLRREYKPITLRGADGRLTGRGHHCHTIEVPLRTRQLRQGDSLLITIRHAMRKQILTGITDVGIKIQKRTKR